MTNPIFASSDAQKLLFSSLRVLGVVKVVVDFSGGGDSGSVNGHRAVSANGDDVDISTTTINWPKLRSHHEYINDAYKYKTKISNESMTLGQIVESLCEIALDHSELDWYNNEGGQGHFIIDITADPPSVTLEIGINHMTTDDHVFEFYEPMTEDDANAPVSP